MEDKRIAKLPKWAQRHIRTLENNLESARKTERQIKGDSPTDTYIKHYTGQDIPLPDGSYILFCSDTVELIARVSDEGIELYTDKILMIRPTSSSTVTIVGSDRW